MKYIITTLKREENFNILYMEEKKEVRILDFFLAMLDKIENSNPSEQRKQNIFHKAINLVCVRKSVVINDTHFSIIE